MFNCQTCDVELCVYTIRYYILFCHMVTTIMKNKYYAHGYYTLTTDFPSLCLILHNVVILG